MLEELCCVESEINRLLNEYEKEERIETKEKLKDDIIEEASTLIATRETLKKLIRSKCPDKIMSIEMDFSVNIKGLNRRVNKLLVRIADKLNFNYEWFIECLSVYSREKMFSSSYSLISSKVAYLDITPFIKRTYQSFSFFPFLLLNKYLR